MTFPSHESIRTWIVKLDYLHSMSRRRIFTMNLRLSFGLSADSSPQAGYDYYVLTEEIMRRTRVELPVPFNPFGGFDYERRTKPITTIGRKQGTVAGKLFNARHTFVVEASVEHLRIARDCVTSYVRDQGSAERGTAKAPTANLTEVREKFAGIKAGDLTYAELISDIKTRCWEPQVFRKF